MRGWTGVVMMVWVAGCAESQPEQKPTRPVASANDSQASAVDPNAITPERLDAIERLFARKTSDLQACWTEEYEKSHNRKLEGDLTLQLNIDAQGRPGDVKILKTTLGNQSIESCVIKAVTAWQFPEGHATIPYNRTVHLGAQF
jgi:TonB family protein